MRARRYPRALGFTLLELIAAIAIVAILLTVALPAYQSYMLRVHRTEAVVALLDIAHCQEGVFAANGRYDTTQCFSSELEHYSVRIDPPQSTGSLSFIAWAEPLGAQREDKCGSLGLDQAGLRQITSEAASADECWNAR